MCFVVGVAAGSPPRRRLYDSVICSCKPESPSIRNRPSRLRGGAIARCQREEHDRGALLRRQDAEQRLGRLARCDRIDVRAGHLVVAEWPLTLEPPHAIDPQVRRDTEQPRARVRRRLAHLRERHERARQGVLRHVLRVPWAAREVAAVSVELRAERLVGVEEAVPAPPQDPGSSPSVGSNGLVMTGRRAEPAKG